MGLSNEESFAWAMKFSIIIPVYNVAPYVRACLESVLAQRYEDWEVICVDDGSTDGSGDILDEYAVADSQIKVIHQGNAGVSSARNLALLKAIGDWILFLDADDVVSPEWLSEIEQMIQRIAGADIIRFGMTEFTQVPKFDGGTGDTREVCLGKVLGQDAFTWNFWRQAYRRGLVHGLLFPSYVIGEDLVYSYSAVFRAHKIGILDRPLYGYRLRPGSAMLSQMSPRKVCDILNYNLDLLSMEGERCYTSQMKRAIVNQLTEGFWYHWIGLQKDERNDLARTWFEDAKNMPGIRTQIVRLSRSELVARLFFVLPQYLKIKGLHR